MVAGVALASVAGCASHQTSAPEYRTVGESPGRDAATARRLNNEAVNLISQGKSIEAESLIRRALDADVTFGPAHNSLGKVYFERRMFYLAAWEFQYAIKLMPYLPEPKNNLGLVLEEVGKLDQAVEQYEQAAAAAPDHPELLANLVRACMKRGDRDERVRALLEEVVMKDSRPEWRDWAGGQLALIGCPRPTKPHGDSHSAKTTSRPGEDAPAAPMEPQDE